jgi:hypothetical protein
MGIIIDQDLFEIIAEEGSWPPGDPYPTMITEGYNDALTYTNR